MKLLISAYYVAQIFSKVIFWLRWNSSLSCEMGITYWFQPLSLLLMKFCARCLADRPGLLCFTGDYPSLPMKELLKLLPLLGRTSLMYSSSLVLKKGISFLLAIVLLSFSLILYLLVLSSIK